MWTDVSILVKGEGEFVGAFRELGLKMIETPDITKIRILLVEDDGINQLVADTMLSNLGYHVDIVSNGWEALEKLKAVRYSLVFMDCMMPEMDGYQTTQLIRDPDSQVLNREIPIIAITGNATSEDLTKCIQNGMNDFLTKPIEQDRISSMISKWVSDLPST